MNRSFYGGPQGQSFIFRAIFPNYLALQTDIGKGFNSEIGVGEFVLISYGDPNKNDGIFNANLQIDATNHNNEVYCKAYDENGFTYQFITNISTVSPAASVTPTVVDSLASPDVTVTSSNGNYDFSFKLPKSARFYMTESTIFQNSENVNNPQDISSSDLKDKVQKGDYIISSNGNIYCAIEIDQKNKNSITFEYQGRLMPPSYENIPTPIASVHFTNGGTPNVRIDHNTDNGDNKLEFTFSLPRGTKIYTGANEPSNSDNVYDGDIWMHDNIILTYKNGGWVNEGAIPFSGQLAIDYVDNTYAEAIFSKTPLMMIQDSLDYIVNKGTDFNSDLGLTKKFTDTGFLLIQVTFLDGSWLFAANIRVNTADEEGNLYYAYNWFNAGALTGTDTPLTIKNQYNENYTDSNEGTMVAYSASIINTKIDELRNEIYNLLGFEEIPSSQGNTEQ